ncbi:MAG: DddA-like double-stranded DNA deaminase toxin [Sciscionella sp.]
MRKVVVLAILVFLAWWLFLKPSSTTFGCKAAGAVAHAASGDCPTSIDAAVGDVGWATDRLADIAGQKRTTGLFYDNEGSKSTFTSGEGDDADAVDEILREEGVPRPRRARLHQAASHVEAKAAAFMRDEGTPAAVLVINNPGGVCEGIYGCQSVLANILPPEARLFVWSPPAIERGTPDEFTGGSE